jgi:signal transduction histidine kinase
MADKNSGFADIIKEISGSELFYKLPVSLFVMDCKKGTILEVNSFFRQRMGFSGRDLKDLSIEELLLFPRENERNKLVNLMKSEKSFSDFRVTMRTKAEKDLNINLSGNVHKLNGESIMCCVMNDMSKQLNILENLKHHLAIERLIMKMASDYINLPLRQANEKIDLFLGELAKFLSADRAYIFRYDFETNTASNLFEWCASGIEPEIDNLQNVPLGEISHWVETHKKGEIMKISDVSSLENKSLKKILEFQRIKSLLTVPVMNGNECLGFVGFDSVKDYYRYTSKEIKLLKLFATILANINIRRELYVAEKRAVESNRVKNEFLSNLSHEIRTPISGIIAALETLQGVLENEEYLFLLNLAHKSALQLETIFDDLYDIIRLNREEYHENKEKVCIKTLLRYIEDLFKVSAEEKGLSFNVRAENVPDYFFSNTSRLKQIISKLVDNAIKFTFAGEVSVLLSYRKLTEQNGLFEIEVSDTGIGIERSTQQKIFEIFYQKDLSLTKEFQGLGLGLPKVSAIIKNLNGNISLKSFLNAGTTITCIIPVIPLISIHPGFNQQKK